MRFVVPPRYMGRRRRGSSRLALGTEKFPIVSFKSQCVTIAVPSAWVTLTLLRLLPKEEALRTESGGGRGAQKSGRSETFENSV